MSNRALELAASKLEQLQSEHLLRTLRVAKTATAPIQTFGDKSYRAFCSNDYLGLANDPSIKAALIEAVGQYGVGSGASHWVSGHSQAHEELESRLARFQNEHIPACTALLFSTGFATNLSVITALTQLASPGQTSLYSANLNHASIIDGVRLAQKMFDAKLTRFDTDALNVLALQLEQDTHPLKIIITDAVFSMDGNLAPLRELLELANRFDALLMVDDAHGFGVLGEQGHGVLSTLHMRSERWVYVGTLGKAAGVCGAFVCAHKDFTQWISQKARPHIYSTASPPALARALSTSLDLIEGPRGHQKRQHLMHLIHLFKAHAVFNHFKLMPSDTPIQPLVLGSNEVALKVSKSLDDMGFMVPAIRPPTVPANTARLRITLSAEHQEQDVMALVEALKHIESSLT
jgi:8-amino-7-oxononanoate synthase